MKTTTTIHRSVVGLLLASSLLLNSGCWLLVVGAAGGAAAAGVAYADGHLTSTLGNGYDAVVTAANRAIDQLQFAKPEEQKDALSDTLTTHTAKGDRVQIVLTRINDNSTKVDIRIGTFGDESLSMTILDKIKANL